MSGVMTSVGVLLACTPDVAGGIYDVYGSSLLGTGMVGDKGYGKNGIVGNDSCMG